MKKWKRVARTDINSQSNGIMKKAIIGQKHGLEIKDEEKRSKKVCDRYFDLTGGMAVEAGVQPRRTP